MKITLLKGWNGNEAGKILDPAEGVALLLIERGYAVELKPEKKKPKLQEWVKNATNHD